MRPHRCHRDLSVVYACQQSVCSFRSGGQKQQKAGVAFSGPPELRYLCPSKGSQSSEQAGSYVPPRGPAAATMSESYSPKGISWLLLRHLPSLMLGSRTMPCTRSRAPFSRWVWLDSLHATAYQCSLAWGLSGRWSQWSTRSCISQSSLFVNLTKV